MSLFVDVRQLQSLDGAPPRVIGPPRGVVADELPTAPTPSVAAGATEPTTAADVDPRLLAEVDGLLRQGKALEAIMRYRSSAGVPLREAKAVIDARAASFR